MNHVSIKKKLSLSTIIIVSSLQLLVLFVSTGSTQTESNIWVGTWSCAPYAAGSGNMPPAPYLENNTLRQVVRVSIGGEKLRMKFSNKTCSTPVTMKSVKIAVSTGGSTIDASTVTELKFDGNSSVTMEPYSSVVSDAFDFSLSPSDRIAITIYYGQAATSADMTSHVASRTDSYILTGDQSSSADFSGATVTAHWFHINTIEVVAPSTSGCVGVIGNSITDGYGLSGGLQNRWTDIFSEELLKNTQTQDVGVLNLGIGGTLVSGTGATTGLSRYKEDLLKQSGMRWIIIYYGTNDIAYGGTTDGIIDAYKTIINDAHTRNIKVYGATITPFKGSGHYSAEHEEMRQTVNQWIRTSGQFDAVIDFDNAMKDPNDHEKLLEQYSKDWLHPNVAGYAFLGKSVDVNLFTEIDNNYPLIADAGQDQTAIDYDKAGTQQVELDGSGSFDFGNDIALFNWTLNEETIATGINPTVSLSAGENTITLTITDVEGNTASDEVIITVSEGSGVWLEAECGTAGSFWSIIKNESSSNGEYVTVKAGNNSPNAAPSDATGLITYSFDVNEGGTYYLYARANCPGANDDSFWIKMDDGAFVMWNGISAPSWQWVQYGTSFNLSKGQHTLSIGYREDGALLDKLWITNNPSSISDAGGTANNCNDTAVKTQSAQTVKVYPNPVTEKLSISSLFTPYTVALFNNKGQKLSNKKVLSSNTSIDMSKYNKGVYFVSVTNSNVPNVQKIIKM